MQFDLATLTAENDLLNAPRYQKEQPFIVECLKRLRLARAPRDYFELHFDLLARFGAHQALVDEDLKKAEADAEAELRRLVSQDPKPIAEIKVQQGILENAKRERKVSNAILHAFRVVGDGIAWRVLGYDRAALTVLGEGVRVGRLAAEIGRDQELAQLGALWDDDGVFAIHNDITNCLRHGDLTVIRPGDGNVRVDLMEVKRTGGQRQDSVQLRRMDRAVQLLNTGAHPAGADGEPLEIIRVPVPYRTFLSNLRDALRGARRRGIAWTRPAPCLAVVTVDYGSSRVDPDRLVEQVTRGRDQLGWFTRDDARVLIWAESQKRLRDRRHSLSAIAPSSILPLDVEDVADLIFGFVDRVTFLNLDLLERAFAQHGIVAEAKMPPDSAHIFLAARTSGAWVTVPPSLREQVMFELMTPSNAIAAVQHLLDLVAGRSIPERKSVVVMADEERVWSSSGGSSFAGAG